MILIYGKTKARVDDCLGGLRGKAGIGVLGGGRGRNPKNSVAAGWGVGLNQLSQNRGEK